MIKVVFALINDDESENLLAAKEFANAKSIHDIEVSQYVYDKVLELDNQYDFVKYENCPTISIIYMNEDGEKIYYDDCVDYMYNL